MPAAQAAAYKLNTGGLGTGTTANARYPIDLNVTLTQFDTKFAAWDIFRSASQICEEYLVPEGQGYTSTSAFSIDWYKAGGNYALVGDNVRERPYTDIYGRVTTKSNSYTVYYTVQALKNAQSATSQNQWNENAGVILSEYRGSTTLERYIDPNPTPALPDFAAVPGSAAGAGTTLEPYYKWRVVENHQFAP
jgi:hypothetical protein